MGMLANSMMTPLLALVIWTFVMWVWLMVTRFSAVGKMGLKPQDLRRPPMLNQLPESAQCVADNYNHLHEQPTLFYALCVYSHLVGVHDGLNVGLAWAYVGLRVAHSVVQATRNVVMVRFSLFLLASLSLMVIAGRNLVALFST